MTFSKKDFLSNFQLDSSQYEELVAGMVKFLSAHCLLHELDDGSNMNYQINQEILKATIRRNTSEFPLFVQEKLTDAARVGYYLELLYQLALYQRNLTHGKNRKRQMRAKSRLSIKAPDTPSKAATETKHAAIKPTRKRRRALSTVSTPSSDHEKDEFGNEISLANSIHRNLTPSQAEHHRSKKRITGPSLKVPQSPPREILSRKMRQADVQTDKESSALDVSNQHASRQTTFTTHSAAVTPAATPAATPAPAAPAAPETPPATPLCSLLRPFFISAHLKHGSQTIISSNMMADIMTTDGSDESDDDINRFSLEKWMQIVQEDIEHYDPKDHEIVFISPYDHVQVVKVQRQFRNTILRKFQQSGYGSLEFTIQTRRNTEE